MSRDAISLVLWRDSHAIQHGRTFATWQEAAEFDAAIKAGKLPRDTPGRRAAVMFGAAAARWLATKRPPTADLYATELRCHARLRRHAAARHHPP